MPISSGATVSQSYDSYLKRYLSNLSYEKRKILENSLEAACFSDSDGENMDDLINGTRNPKQSEESQSEGDTTGEKALSKKSSTCTVL